MIGEIEDEKNTSGTLSDKEIQDAQKTVLLQPGAMIYQA